MKEKLEQESTIDEESFEIDHEVDSTVRTYLNKRGSAVKRPKQYMERMWSSGLGR